MNPPTHLTEVFQEYNVYAHPFIPEQLRQVNREPGTIATTPSRHFIDFHQYVQSFAGSSLLPEAPIPPPQNPTSITHSISQQGPTAAGYFSYFSSMLIDEIEAQQKENESLAMYRVHIQSSEENLLSISVPGLREESPRVELGDTLELRQLWGEQHAYFQPYIQFPRLLWTGIIHHASVYGIHRAEERVYLRVDGWDPSSLKNSHVPTWVNVVFPLKRRPLHIGWSSLIFINDSLSKALHASWGDLRQGDHIMAQNNLIDRMNGLNINFNPLNSQVTGINGHSRTEKRNEWIRRMLFPLEEDGEIQTELRKIPQRKLFDAKVNYEQAHAIDSVCMDDYGCLPYLISGPPGTGKTKTLVEMAMQLLESHMADHILICAPSEAAADTLALRLQVYLNPSQLLRLNGPWRADNEVPLALMQNTHMENDMFMLPPFKQFMTYNIVVTSCRDASILADAHLTNTSLWTLERNIISAFHPESNVAPPKLHWGALLLDEAAQATELDALPALSVVCPPSEYPSDMAQPRFVMAGDENQLGPKTASLDSRFSISLFARLFSRTLYKNHPLSRHNTKPSTAPVLKKSMLPITYPPFTNLVRNYRSHPAILGVPSSLFYNDTLLPEAIIPQTALQTSQLWRGRKWPVLFIPHTHADEIERDGGGWYNVREASMACSIAAHLIRQDGVRQSSICIISPFAAQVKRLRATLRSSVYGFREVNIGPLEAFQGLEKRVVIISTTRTRERFLDQDRQRGLGIVGQPRKMNVALTRAKEALIVLGNPYLLAKDKWWREWLAFCWQNGLVADDEGTWDGKAVPREKVGILEKALLAKETKFSESKALGAAAGDHGYGPDPDQEWIESLKEAMEEEDDDEDYEGYDDDDDDEHRDDQHDVMTLATQNILNNNNSNPAL